MHQIWLKSYFWELMSQIWNIFLGVILVNLLYLKNYLEYFRSVWSAKKYIFSNKILKTFAWPKEYTQKKYWCLKMLLTWEDLELTISNFQQMFKQQMRIFERHSTRHLLKFCLFNFFHAELTQGKKCNILKINKKCENA